MKVPHSVSVGIGPRSGLFVERSSLTQTLSLLDSESGVFLLNEKEKIRNKPTRQTPQKRRACTNEVNEAW